MIENQELVIVARLFSMEDALHYQTILADEGIQSRLEEPAISGNYMLDWNMLPQAEFSVYVSPDDEAQANEVLAALTQNEIDLTEEDFESPAVGTDYELVADTPEDKVSRNTKRVLYSAILAWFSPLFLLPVTLFLTLCVLTKTWSRADRVRMVVAATLVVFNPKIIFVGTSIWFNLFR